VVFAIAFRAANREGMRSEGEPITGPLSHPCVRTGQRGAEAGEERVY
jgi:hypothetical protein